MRRLVRGPQDPVRVSTHELLNIAASVSGCARTLLDSGGRLPPGQRAELLRVIVAQSERIERLAGGA